MRTRSRGGITVPQRRSLYCGPAAVALFMASCGAQSSPPSAPYIPVGELEAVYGPLITVANHPTPDQHGTGDRLGIFLDRTGTVWGLPLKAAPDGTVLGCAPETLRAAPVTDTLPAGADIVGATNEPTGWRDGTGKLELVFRDKAGRVFWKSVTSGALATGPSCWAQVPPGPRQRLDYYRLSPPLTDRR
jgi:hypothetical protein